MVSLKLFVCDRRVAIAIPAPISAKSTSHQLGVGEVFANHLLILLARHQESWFSAMKGDFRRFPSIPKPGIRGAPNGLTAGTSTARSPDRKIGGRNLSDERSAQDDNF
jgi:hypothetical protein